MRAWRSMDARAGAPRQRCRDEGGRCGGEVPRERVVGAATETAAGAKRARWRLASSARDGAACLSRTYTPGRAECGAPTLAERRTPSPRARVPTVWRA